eukprot:60666_1
MHNQGPLQDSGLTLQFPPDKDNAAQILSEAHRGFVPLTPLELQQEAQKAKNDQGENTVIAKFHDMDFLFRRDRKPSGWGAHQLNEYNEYNNEYNNEQQGYYYHQHDILYNIIYMIPFIICTIAIFCIVCIISVYIGYIITKLYKKRKRKIYIQLPYVESQIDDHSASIQIIE